MTAAVKTLTETSRTKLGNLEVVTGTVTSANTNDWININLLTPPLDNAVYARATTAADGTDGEAFVTSGSGKITLSGTAGALQVIIFAPSLASTGGD